MRSPLLAVVTATVAVAAEPARGVHDPRFQDQLLEELARSTATRLA